MILRIVQLNYLLHNHLLQWMQQFWRGKIALIFHKICLSTELIVICRLFVVCHPSPPPLYALKDIFGRFGNLIDIFMLNGKNFGYAKYASKSSADEAKNVS